MVWLFLHHKKKNFFEKFLACLKFKKKCKVFFFFFFFFFVDLAIKLWYYNNNTTCSKHWWMKVEECTQWVMTWWSSYGSKWYGEVSIIELWKWLVIHKVTRQSSKHLLILTQCGPLSRGYVQGFLHTHIHQFGIDWKPS
jgi:hypothetical protein